VILNPKLLRIGHHRGHRVLLAQVRLLFHRRLLQRHPLCLLHQPESRHDTSAQAGLARLFLLLPLLRATTAIPQQHLHPSA
jgi:hypothetical protein